MDNFIILGSARSGTSMLAEVFHRSGFYLGSDLMPGKPGNPHGYFECRNIESTNEDLLDQIVPARPQGRFARIRQLLHKRTPNRPRRWLLALDQIPSLNLTSDIENKIKETVRRQPFCLKDPRFCYTLPTWSSLLPPYKRICVFRHPAATISSIKKEIKQFGHDKEVSVSRKQLERLWESSYACVRAMEGDKIPTLWIHSLELLEEVSRKRVEDFVGMELDWSCVDPKLNRSKDNDLKVSKRLVRQFEEFMQYE